MAAPAAAAAHHYHFEVEMTCGGCSGAVNRVLGKMEGIQKYTADHNTKMVDVYADEGVAYETVLEKIKKTGKAVTKGEKDGVDAAV
ncbi:MAG: hypothetical protein LQ346_005581 [Caloplaca aetnensis]|nr:MAG: hypothetical protein LQ346_005581 [Caloplaca aetnensis]